MELPELGGEENGEVAPVGGGAQPPRRKKRRRKRFRSDSHLREEGGSSSEEREREQNEQESPAKEQYVSQLQLRSVIKATFDRLWTNLLYKDKYATMTQPKIKRIRAR